jgi:hypothetical protein
MVDDMLLEAKRGRAKTLRSWCSFLFAGHGECELIALFVVIESGRMRRRWRRHLAGISLRQCRGFFVCSLLEYGVTWWGRVCRVLHVHIHGTADILVGVFCSSHPLQRLRLRDRILGLGIIQYFSRDFDAFCRLLPGCRSVGNQLARFVCSLAAIVDGRAAHVHSSAETGICIRRIEFS